jgi:hypothetical protein
MTTKSYCTPADVRAQIIKLGSEANASDSALKTVIAGVSQTLDRLFNRADGFLADETATARKYAGSGGPLIFIDECVAITLVAVKDSPSDASYVSWAASDWIPFTGDPDSPDFNRLPYTGLMVDPNGTYDSFTSGEHSTWSGFKPIGGTKRVVPTVQVTAKWGYSATTPPIIAEATIALSARWFKQAGNAWADTLATADFGKMIYMAQNADIRLMLDNARLRRVALGRR